MVKRQVPVTGIIFLVAVVALVIYIAYTKIDNQMIRLIVIAIPLIIAVSALLGLRQEYGIADKIIKKGLVDEYLDKHGLGNRKTFDEFIEELKMRGYRINPGTKAQLRKEIIEGFERRKK
ncbi:MAG: hypothetical protein KAV48_00290 [Methanomicrobia archaeon]|nr:hypothetical protein [Methanomicrobia archaeon]MCK4432350.1 hypothetical protein [Methanomicrobia archaeon]